jgi:DNA-binding response OmpR family regulator
MHHVTSPARPALLVVEDDDILREAVGFVLSGEGYEIALASSGEDALALVAEVDAFHGLYTDINLPGPVDGWVVGAAFHRKWPAAPIVYASARDWQTMRVAPSGVFLRKPFAFGVLLATLAGG